MSEEARQQLLVAAFKDKNSAIYKNMCAILREADANERRAKANGAYVGFPFPLNAQDQSALEAQFQVRIKVNSSVKRMPLTDRVAGMITLLDAALMEHASGPGKDVVVIDGDLVTMAACGINGVCSERSNATARLALGYNLEDEHLHLNAANKSEKFQYRSDLLHSELTSGGGEHYSPVVRDTDEGVSAILINHFKTPVGAHQAAYLAKKRAAVVYGCIPFQHDMLVKDEGSLRAFPGRFYIDRGLDALTMVPAEDAALSVSMPYSAWYSIVCNNSVTVDGVEFLCEKYNSVPGILYYTMNPLNRQFDAPEKLRTNYFNTKNLGVTEVQMPIVKFSAEGVPVGWDRKTVRVFSDRLEKTIARLVCSANEIVTPSEAFNALIDHNNTVINTMDATTLAKRMDVDEEMDLATALALHVNVSRHNARGTFKVLLSAVKKRYDIAEANLFSMAAIALYTWWSSPTFERKTVYDELPAVKILDWCGNDFSVVMNEADPWLVIAQDAGVKRYSVPKYYDFMPRPRSVGSKEWLEGFVNKVMFHTSRLIKCGDETAEERKTSSSTYKMTSDILKKPDNVVVKSSKVGIRGMMTKLRGGSKSLAVVAPTEVLESELIVKRSPVAFTDVKDKLRRQLTYQQGAHQSVDAERSVAIIVRPEVSELIKTPVTPVEPISAIQSDLLMVNKGVFENIGPKTGYRLAETDISKNISGDFMINDSKRGIPKDRFVRLPVVDAGVEGNRAGSQIALFAAMAKRNVGVPGNRGVVDLDNIAPLAVDRMIATCYKENWQEIVNKHLDHGLWEFNSADVDNFVDGIDEKKVNALLKTYFSEGLVELDKWQLFAKPGVKSSREAQTQGKIDHAQTILFLRDPSTNAAYSAMIKHLKECVDECLRPNVHIVPQMSDAEQEEWYNSIEPLRKSCAKTFSYGSDIRTFDRSQELPSSRVHMEFYRRHGLSESRLEKWTQMYGVKKASSMMFGIVAFLTLGGISGVFDTIMRNSINTWAAIVVSAKLERKDVITLDIKGDDADLETSRPIDVEQAVESMSLTFNFSAKMFTNDVRYFCKQFRVKTQGRWIQIADPWARVQSLCKPIVMDGHDAKLEERYKSLVADLRHYDNGLLVDLAAECAQVYYGLERPLYGMANGLAAVAADPKIFYSFFKPAERIN